MNFTISDRTAQTGHPITVRQLRKILEILDKSGIEGIETLSLDTSIRFSQQDKEMLNNMTKASFDIHFQAK